ncbi:MAG: radical SAM protein [Armatimonadetes bacterium]|nr:radical SAM protein [Armatimonadota bacterium]NIM24189.1 radical SAM protein [Armatimonadota bacterium]NIM68054.1 radical SAM protein [Armatimonadota bacterium]NIM76088.1 radical SAM protein [Armatimonadota bacterium]NIN05759.1 radical SAM protein [Armatimonadota bacterium]
MDADALVAELEKLSDWDLQDVIQRVLGRVMKVTLTRPATTLDLVVTLNCNLRCDYCFVAGKDRATTMSLSTAQRAIDFFIGHSARKSHLEIVFFGGEPLLELELMRSAAAYARVHAAEKKKAMRFSITTNGTLIDDAALEFAEEFDILYMLSLDGAKRTHDLHRRSVDGRGTFDRIARNIPLLKQRQDWLAARMTISPDTAATLTEDVQSLFDLGINQFFIEPDFFADWSAEQISAYEEQYQRLADLYIELRSGNQPIRILEFETKPTDRRHRYAGRWGCHAGRGRLTITPDGSLYPCNRFPGLGEGNGECRLGDLEEGFINYAPLRDLMDDRHLIRPSCRECAVADYCQGGCPAANLATCASIYTVPPVYCAQIRALASILDSRAEALEKYAWGAESPVKPCCGDEPPCSDLFPIAPPNEGAQSVAADTAATGR